MAPNTKPGGRKPCHPAIVQAFRRDDSPYETARLKLRGLEPEATYRLHDFDRPQPLQARGKDLMETGLLVRLPQRRSSCIIQYQRVKPLPSGER